ncbi:hypothetical protein FQZ97_1006240 [compost metagenome]
MTTAALQQGDIDTGAIGDTPSHRAGVDRGIELDDPLELLVASRRADRVRCFDMGNRLGECGTIRGGLDGWCLDLMGDFLRSTCQPPLSGQVAVDLRIADIGLGHHCEQPTHCQGIALLRQ